MGTNWNALCVRAVAMLLVWLCIPVDLATAQPVRVVDHRSPSILAGVGLGLGYGTGTEAYVDNGGGRSGRYLAADPGIRVWVIPFDCCGFGLGMDRGFVKASPPEDSVFWAPSVSVRFGSLRREDSVWSVTANARYLSGTTETYSEDGPLHRVSTTGVDLAILANARTSIRNGPRTTLSFGIRVGESGPGDPESNYYGSIYALLVFDLELGVGLL